MSEFEKVIISFVLLIVLCTGCFFAGYILSNRRATEQLNNANRQLREQQQKYDILIRETEERIDNIRTELQAKLSNNNQATTELRTIIEQIKEQSIDI